jgi:single-strand DNA-binding protein
MASLNKVLLIGNLGKDPELKYTPGGQAVATFSLATTRKWRDKQSNEDREDTQWHNIKVWGKQAEIAQQYLKKGRQVYIEGRLETRSYDDKDGNRKWFTEVVLSGFDGRFLMLGRRDDAPSGDYAGSGAPAGQAAPAPPVGEDDDLPF